MKIRHIGLIGLIAPACVFAQSPEVLINPQGLAQRDLSIRGGSYTGSGLSINGLNLRVPYSAHFNADLPVYGPLLSEPAAQFGLDNAGGPLIGSMAYVTIPTEPHAEVSAGIGTREHYAGGAAGFTDGLGGFLALEKARRIDYDANDLDRVTGGAVVQHAVNDWQLDLIGAGQRRRFGAQGYYGIPAATYAEQETQDGLLYLGAVRGDLYSDYLRAGAAWRTFDDRLTGPAPFAHDVRSHYGTVLLEGRTLEIQRIALNLRGDLEYEAVDGSAGAQDRTRGSLLLLPELRLEQVTLKAGIHSVFRSNESAAFLPQAGVDWFATDNLILYAAYTESVRQPDYQTLENNPLLQEQAAGSTELGLRHYVSEHMDWRAAVFHRRLQQASDWIGGTAATDLGTLNTAGADALLRCYPSERLTLKLYYQWLHKDNSRTDGFYELDYPEHLLNLSADWRFLDEFTLQFVQSARLQTENDARSSGDFGADASLGLHYRPRFAQNVRLSFRVDNLWGSNFQAVPGLKPRPVTAHAGITAAW